MSLKIIKKITIVLIIFYLLFSILYNVKALTISQMEQKLQNFKKAGKTQVNWGPAVKEFADLGSILTMVGAGVMVIITTYMGIKYLTAGPEAQAKLKTQLIGVVVSGVVIFGAYNIWQSVLKAVKNF